MRKDQGIVLGLVHNVTPHRIKTKDGPIPEYNSYLQILTQKTQHTRLKLDTRLLSPGLVKFPLWTIR